MTIERQALVERLRKLARERATDIAVNECPPEAECDDCDSVRAMREAADALEALSSSAPVETPLPAARACEASKRLREASQRAHYRFPPSIHSPHHLGEWIDCAHRDCVQDRILAEALEAPADPPKPGDEERIRNIASKHTIDLFGRMTEPLTREQRWNLIESAMREALSDYEIKAGGK